jgi:cobalt-zinc-cadmium efflux system protein
MHDHSHSHGPASYNRAFALGVVLNVVFVAIEAAFGWWGDSLALLADAGHNLSDVLGLLLAWGASYLSSWRPSQRRTYGLRRSTILAALLNAILLLLAVGGITWEAIERLARPEPVSGWTMIVVAAAGVVVNTVTALLFLRGGERDLSIRGAYLHMAADAAVSLGVVAGGIAILATGALWIDPLVSLIVVAVITWGTWGLLQQSVDLSLDAVPAHIDPAAVHAYLSQLAGVTEVHDLHIWAMSTTEAALTVHLIRPEAGLDDDWLHGVAHELHDRFEIEHATIQVESGRGLRACRLAPHDVV